MASFEVATFSELPAFEQVVELDGQEYRLRLEYKSRTGSWYLDLRDTTGREIVVGRRLSPEFSPTFNLFLENGPPGVLLARGPDNYDRHDLGEDLVVVYVPEGELPELPVDSDRREVRL